MFHFSNNLKNSIIYLETLVNTRDFTVFNNKFVHEHFLNALHDQFCQIAHPLEIRNTGDMI
jgi:hypothetical protein